MNIYVVKIWYKKSNKEITPIALNENDFFANGMLKAFYTDRNKNIAYYTSTKIDFLLCDVKNVKKVQIIRFKLSC